MKKHIGVLLSGRGSNFEALADKVAAGRIPNAEIAIVISNREGAPGIEKAQARGIESHVIPSKGLEREAYDRQVVTARRISAASLASFRSGVPEPHLEHSPVAASGVSGTRIAAPGSGTRREIFRLHGALRERKSGCRADCVAGVRADRR